MLVADDADPKAVKRSSRKVLSAERTWAGELEVVTPVAAVPVDAAVVPALPAVLATPGVELVEVVVTVVTGVLVPAGALVVTGAFAAAFVVALAAEAPVEAALPAMVWPKAWKTASMTVLIALSILPGPWAGAPAGGAAVGVDVGAVAALLPAAFVAVPPLSPKGVNQFCPPLPYALTFIAIPFTLCAVDRAGREGKGFEACGRSWPPIRPTVSVTASGGDL